MAVKRGLGRGLGALIKDALPEERDAPAATGVQTVSLASIEANPLQPRKAMDDAALGELADSIRANGVLQPLLVRPRGAGYELIAGERRLLASQAAGLTDVPVVVRDTDDNGSLALALIENLQREDLNIVEEADGYQLLADQFDMTQEQIAERVGKARPTVANAMRLLGLPDEIKNMLSAGTLSAGHAKVLQGLEIPEEQLVYGRLAVKDGLSVRALEKLIARATRVPRKPRAERADMDRTHLADLVDRLRRHFGTRVRVTPSRTLANGKKAKGALEIEFHSNDELTRILDLLGVEEQ